MTAEPDAEQAEKIAHALYACICRPCGPWAGETIDVVEAARALGVSAAAVLEAARSLKVQGVEIP